MYVELISEFVILSVVGEWEGQGFRVMGFWIYNDYEEMWQVNFVMIQEVWKIVSLLGVVEGIGFEVGLVL